MLKKQSKKLAILLVLSMIASLFVGVGTASAANGVAVSVSRVVTAEDDQGKTQIGNLQIKEDSDYKDAIASGDSFVLTLPTNLKWQKNGSAYVEEVPGLDITISGNYTMTCTVNDADDSKKDVYSIPMFVNFDGVESGYAYITVDGMDSPIPSGQYAIAQVLSGGTTTTCVDSFTLGPDSEGNFTIRITETAVGNFDYGDVVKLTLPSKVKFTKAEINGLAGFSGSVKDYTIDDNKLKFTLAEGAIKLTESGDVSRGIIEIKAYVNVDSSAKEGDVYLDVEGDNVDDETVKVGKIAEYGVALDVDDPTTVLAGRTCQEFGTITIYENVKETLVSNRSIKIELPDGVQFAGPYKEKDIDVTKGNATVTLTDADESSITFKTDIAAGSARVKIEVPMSYLNIEADFAGDVVATVSGRAGVEGEVVIGTVTAPVEIAVANVADVKCGFQNQALGAITITETEAGAMLEDGEVWIELPAGVEFQDKAVDVEVTEGNLEISGVKVKAPTNKDNAYITFTVDSESSASQPGTVTISNVYLDVDRTVAEGAIKATVTGTALVWSYDYDDYDKIDYLVEQYEDSLDVDICDGAEDVSDYLFSEDEIGRFVIANCVTEGIENGASDPAATGNGGATFVIGSTAAVINGDNVTLPVAPYISNSRTMVPVRYVAYACGITEDNIIWNPDLRTVTLVDGNGVVVQLTIGSATMLNNGIPVIMDCAPEITGDYTFLPARYVANAFGFNVDWEAATQTVTVF